MPIVTDSRDIIERLNLARSAMAKLTSSRNPVHIHIPPDRDDADMLICGACEDAETEITRLRTALEAAERERDGLRAEIVRLRHGLNQIAWPGQFGINSEQATADMFRHIAQDTLAIGVPVANGRVAARAAAGESDAARTREGGKE